MADKNNLLEAERRASRFDRLESIIYIVLAIAVLGMVAYALFFDK